MIRTAWVLLLHRIRCSARKRFGRILAAAVLSCALASTAVAPATAQESDLQTCEVAIACLIEMLETGADQRLVTRLDAQYATEDYQDLLEDARQYPHIANGCAVAAPKGIRRMVGYYPDLADVPCVEDYR